MDDNDKIPFIQKAEYKGELIWLQYYDEQRNTLHLMTEKHAVYTIWESVSGKKITTTKDRVKAITLMNEYQK